MSSAIGGASSGAAENQDEEEEPRGMSRRITEGQTMSFPRPADQQDDGVEKDTEETASSSKKKKPSDRDDVDGQRAKARKRELQEKRFAGREKKHKR